MTDTKTNKDLSCSYSYANILQKAWPIILANAAVPLLGFVDTAIIGNLGTTVDLGAIALGSLIFSFVYLSFAFLRMSTSGFASQALGKGSEAEIREVLGRGLFISLILGFLLILLQNQIGHLALSLLSGSESVEKIVKSYFEIRIFGAPATLTMFVLTGILVGLGSSRLLLVSQVFLNFLNILFDLILAGTFNMGAVGIAYGTLGAEWLSVVFTGILVFRTLKKRDLSLHVFFDWPSIFNAKKIKQTLSASSDIMIRTLCLLFCFSFFTNQSSLFGDNTLAANHILLQMISFCAFFLDGYAFVSESLVGRAIGASDRVSYLLAVKRSSVLSFATAALLALALFFFGNKLLFLLTDLEAVRTKASLLLPYASLYVFISFAAYLLDGIFIGAAQTRAMMLASLLSAAFFLFSYYFILKPYGVFGLWWAFIFYVLARAFSLLIFFKDIHKKFTIPYHPDK